MKLVRVFKFDGTDFNHDDVHAVGAKDPNADYVRLRGVICFDEYIDLKEGDIIESIEPVATIRDDGRMNVSHEVTILSRTMRTLEISYT